jgi:glycosyltransferase involved in cell wall biosynthesis
MTHGRDGLFLRDVRSAEELAAAIVRVRDDPALRELLSSRGKASALRFAWPVVMEETLEAYKTVARDSVAHP